MNTTSKTTRISALLPTNLVEEIRNISNQENKTQSSIIKNALEFWFKKKLEKDTKALSKINFDDLPSEDEWLSIQPKI
jgi:metal-responsive CopG/Arc/MetJ family transcriptional regulator